MRSQLLVLSLLVGITIPASSALAALPQPGPGIGIRLIGEPADAGNGPLTRLYIVERLAPGESVQRSIEISNSTGSSANIAVYPAGASLRRGSFQFAPGHSLNPLSRWTSVSRPRLRLAPGTKTVETVTIKVPRHALGDERYAVVWAAVSAAAPGGIRLVNRVGIRMYVSNRPGGAVASNFTIGSPIAKRLANGAPFVVATIHNSGKRPLQISGTLTLSDGPGGLRVGPLPVRVATALAAGSSAEVTVRLDRRIPPGPWRAQIRLRSGQIQRTALATITFPRDAGAAKQPTARVAPAGHHKTILLATILLILLAVVAFALLLSRHASSAAR
jgi:hypothetical protein